MGKIPQSAWLVSKLTSVQRSLGPISIILGGLVVIVLVIGTKVSGFKPGKRPCTLRAIRRLPSEGK
jgi:hypothetical protein